MKRKHNQLTKYTCYSMKHSRMAFTYNFLPSLTVVVLVYLGTPVDVWGVTVLTPPKKFIFFVSMDGTKCRLKQQNYQAMASHLRIKC